MWGRCWKCIPGGLGGGAPTQFKSLQEQCHSLGYYIASPRQGAQQGFTDLFLTHRFSVLGGWRGWGWEVGSKERINRGRRPRSLLFWRWGSWGWMKGHTGWTWGCPAVLRQETRNAAPQGGVESSWVFRPHTSQPFSQQSGSCSTRSLPLISSSSLGRTTNCYWPCFFLSERCLASIVVQGDGWMAE